MVAVAEGDDVHRRAFGLDLLEVVAAPATRTDHGQVQLLVRREAAGRRRSGRGGRGKAAGHRGGACQEGAAGEGWIGCGTGWLHGLLLTSSFGSRRWRDRRIAG